MLPKIKNTHKHEGALNEEGPGNKVLSWTKQTMFILNLFNYVCISFHCFEDALDGVINEVGAHCFDDEHGVQMSDAPEHVSGNDNDDDLRDVFDWY
jgi:hypothetical protein